MHLFTSFCEFCGSTLVMNDEDYIPRYKASYKDNDVYESFKLFEYFFSSDCELYICESCQEHHNLHTAD